jgi:hypothetical protein
MRNEEWTAGCRFRKRSNKSTHIIFQCAFKAYSLLHVNMCVRLSVCLSVVDGLILSSMSQLCRGCRAGSLQERTRKCRINQRRASLSLRMRQSRMQCEEFNQAFLLLHFVHCSSTSFIGILNQNLSKQVLT